MRAHVKLGRLPVHGNDPVPKAREAPSQDLKEGTPMDGIEGVSDVESNINPAGMLIKDGLG